MSYRPTDNAYRDPSQTASVKVLTDLLGRYVEFDTNGGCWLWSGAMRSTTELRPAVSVPGRGVVSAYRLAWEVNRGPIPDGLFVCHSCDTPPCVNPDHLFLGTHRANMRDMVSKGRAGMRRDPERASAIGRRLKALYTPRGEENGTSKLTAADVLAIRASALPGAALAREYGVSGTTIRKIRRHLLWKHV